ncbi:hypothetical protein AUEXF2481DRAFT_43635 [Aureobasidium subglaciale EXF-2481]|uniref:Protein kinase domain-containing protein n=1 Tax=Aureobasidium subglaciale (strain EXF-2481) TaxID=1043005 RepID=A0A074Y2I5_AURSE|nr:uncharacterized protein AUEXF2481DRAFT_43635 [Aureobasidium subglaciale EXF-2481]KEQ91940.1 hypothetical protein AUEXF2481DRAFT_43635 [Aureobasidium subglaciale EXF-2481]
MGNSISNPTSTPLLPGTIATSFNRKGKYTTKTLLGTGNHGSTYHVTSPTAVFALKVISTSTASHLLKFRQEATILATLSHPHIIPLEDIAGVQDPATQNWNSCLITPLASQNLQDFHIKHSALNISGLNEAIAQTLAYQMLSALEYLHTKGIVYRNLKPTNILLFPGQSKSQAIVFALSDFGLAAHFLLEDSSSSSSSSSSSLQASARYASPEALLCTCSPDLWPKSDIWALGRLCRDVLTRALVFPHVEEKGIGCWGKETVEWMMRESVYERPTAGMCREAVWVRRGGRMGKGFVDVLRGEEEGQGEMEDMEM